MDLEPIDNELENDRDLEFEQEFGLVPPEEDFGLIPKETDKHHKYLGLLKNILPYLGSDEGKIVLAEVMIALKLEGVIGKKISNRETKMVNVIKDAILTEPEKREQAIKFAKNLISDGGKSDQKMLSD